MIINLTTPMSDDKERERHTKAVLDAIEQYTEKKMNEENTDGSRSGGEGVVTTGLDRSIEQFFFEVGYGACFADAFIKNGVVPFELTDAIVERAWAIAPEAHEDGAEFDRYLAAAQTLRQPTQSDALREALEAAPLIGHTESVYDFMKRQDAWLKGPYRAAMQEQSK